ncbi:MAG: hypothetical protein L0Z50_21040 [Verrucomicrobiales bacterium]|nr:hypothetical protein [Verrucomicrobiales bacterium]
MLLNASLLRPALRVFEIRLLSGLNLTRQPIFALILLGDLCSWFRRPPTNSALNSIRHYSNSENLLPVQRAWEASRAVWFGRDELHEIRLVGQIVKMG